MRPADRLARVVPVPENVAPGEHRRTVEEAVGPALILIGMVRDQDPADAAEFWAGLPEGQRGAVPFILAAFAQVDLTPAEMLAWLGWAQPIRYDGATAVTPPAQLRSARPRPARSRDCGSEGGWRQACRCDLCKIAHDAFVRSRRARDRASARKRRLQVAPAPRVRVTPLMLPLEWPSERRHAAGGARAAA